MNTNKLTQFVITAVLGPVAICCTTVNSYANAVFRETYIIINGGPQSGDYYYEGLDNGGGNVRFDSINQSINLLSGATLTLKGAEAKTLMSGGDYQNSNNGMTNFYRFYDSASTAPSYTSQVIPFVRENPYPENLFQKSDASVNLLSGQDSGVHYMDFYMDGNASYFSGGQQFFDMTQTPTYRATFTLFYGATTTATQSAAFTGTGYFNFNGIGQTYTLDKANTYSGETQIDAGTVAVTGSLNSSSMIYIGNGANSSAAALSLSGTTTLANNIQVNVSTGSGARDIIKADGTSQTISGNVTNNRNSTINVTNSSGNLTLSGVVSGGSGLTKSGSGTLVFSGSSANTLSGGLTVNSGTVVFNKSANTSAVAGQTTVSSGASLRTDAVNQFGNNLVTVNGTLDLANNNQSLALEGAGTVTLGSAILTNNVGGTDTFAGKISGTGGLVKVGVGTAFLSGASDYTGATTVSAGVIEVQNGSALGTTATGTTVADGATVKLYHASSMTLGEAFTINGVGDNSQGSLRNVGGDNTISGNITLGSNSRIGSTAGSLALNGNVAGGANVLFVGSSNSITIGGAISGAGNTQSGTTTSLYKDGAGTLTLSGANTYTGDTRVTAGRLVVGSGGSLGSGSDVFLSDGAVLAVNTSTTIASVQETGSSNGGEVAIGAGATLTINGANKGTLFQDTISGSGNLTVDASGTTSLSIYGSQTYTGATAVSGGKLSTAVALASSGVTVSGGTFETTAANILGSSASVSISGTGTYSLGGNDTVGSFSIGGGTLGGSSTLTAATYALNGGNINAVLGAGAITVGGGTNALGSAGRLNSSSSLTVNSGELSLGGNETIASLAGNGGTVKLGANSLTLAGNSYSNRFDGVISGTGSLIKNGTGTLSLAGINTYSGGTFLNGGYLDSESTDAFGTGSINVGASTTLDLQSHNVANLIINNGGTILSSGTVSDVVASNGTTSIGGSDSVVVEASGNAVVNVSGSNVTVSNVSGSAAVNIGGTDATVDAVSGGTVTLSNAATGSKVNTASAGTVNANAAGVNVGTVSNTATVNVGGANGRVTTLAGGTVNANAAGLVVTNFNGGNIAVATNLTVGLRSGNSAGVISGSGGIAKQSVGTLTLSGVNTYSGDTTVEQGKLVVDGSIANSSVTVQSGAVLGGSGTVGDTTILSGAKIGPGNSPGTLNIAGDLTWSGGGSYDWEIYNTVGAAGSEWDLIDVSGSLLFSGLSSGNTFTINIFSLSALPNTVGMLDGWNSATSWSWTILSAGSTIDPINAANFTLNTANFTSANSLDGGMFSLAADGGNLNLLFTPGGGPGPSPVPEPGTWAAAALLAGAAGYVRWRRRKEQPKDA